MDVYWIAKELSAVGGLTAEVVDLLGPNAADGKYVSVEVTAHPESDTAEELHVTLSEAGGWSAFGSDPSSRVWLLTAGQAGAALRTLMPRPDEEDDWLADAFGDARARLDRQRIKAALGALYRYLSPVGVFDLEFEQGWADESRPEMGMRWRLYRAAPRDPSVAMFWIGSSPVGRRVSELLLEIVGDVPWHEWQGLHESVTMTDRQGGPPRGQPLVSMRWEALEAFGAQGTPALDAWTLDRVARLLQESRESSTAVLARVRQMVAETGRDVGASRQAEAEL